MRPVVVAGGGVAGATTAIALARRGVPCIVLERSNPGEGREPIGECLTPAAAVPLATLGLWAEFVEQRHRPSYANVSHWGGDQPVVHNFLFEPHGRGWFLDRARFEAWLLDVAAQRGAEVRRGVKVAGCHRVADAVAIDLESSRTIETDLVVDATGPTARIARQLGAVRHDHDRMIAWALRLRGRVDDDVLLIEPARDGWWYSTPLPDEDVVAVFVTDAATRFDRTAWQERLAATTAIAARCAGCVVAGEPRPHKLVVGRLDRFAGAGWLAVGDAALSRDPLAAVGIARALESGIAAADAIADERVADHGRDLEQAFEEHLEVRASFYRAQLRWSMSPFWARRSVVLDDPITLHPATPLALARASLRGVPPELGTQLCPQEWRRLTDVVGPLPAAELARRITRDRHTGDRRVVGALQRMVHSGALRPP